jgi:hypothetical protein
MHGHQSYCADQVMARFCHCSLKMLRMCLATDCWTRPICGYHDSSSLEATWSIMCRQIVKCVCIVHRRLVLVGCVAEDALG